MSHLKFLVKISTKKTKIIILLIIFIAFLMTHTNCDKQDVVSPDLRHSVKSQIICKTMMCARQMVQRVYCYDVKKLLNYML